MILFRIQFDAKYLSYDANIQAFSNGVASIKDSHQLKQVFIMILKIGNFLNQNDKMKGNKPNFKPELLTSLSLTKGVGPHKGVSMMDFILQMIMNNQP